MLELLVVMAIIAIVSAIATTNYFLALTRAKQKRTVADIRAIALAWEARAVDSQSYLPSGASGYTFPTVPVTYPALRASLVPTYTKNLPQFDGWQRPLEFGFDPETGGAGGYAIRSGGRDGIFDPVVTPGDTTSPDCDIIFANGSFVTFPTVAQTQ